MHLAHEYYDLIEKVMKQAEQMVACLPSGYHQNAVEILDFLQRYGCKGFPGSQAGSFTVGPWLGREGGPTHQHDGITIIPCFTGDAAVGEAQESRAGHCLYTDQVILLYGADQWSVPELALTLLHEARHARQRIGPKLAGLPPLDVDQLHEGNTWMFTLNVLIAWGGHAWDAAVQQEVVWITQQPLISVRPGQLMYFTSQQYWPELDDVFGQTAHEVVRRMRRQFVAMHANMVHWSQQNPSLTPEQICHALVAHFYQ